MSAATISATVGRVVWYYKYLGQGKFQGPLAAHIAKVFSDELVNLMVIEENGQSDAQTSVPLLQKQDEEQMGSYCCWPPYSAKK